MTVAQVRLWGTKVGNVSYEEGDSTAKFEYDTSFLKGGIEISPIMMPLSSNVYSFPALSKQTFQGLPGMLADSLPDKFGNALINNRLEKQGRTSDSLSPVEKLCYIGRRGVRLKENGIFLRLMMLPMNITPEVNGMSLLKRADCLKRKAGK